MPKLKKGTLVPGVHEDLDILRGITQDPDTVELVDAHMKGLRRVGRPPSASPKVAVTVRYDKEVIEGFQAGGPGWQTRMNIALREWLKDHPQHPGKCV
jgi:uncharacterized protein (DUF4415 family)